jgi:hypothetical protein
MIVFPFTRKQQYTLQQLRRFEARLLEVRQATPGFSADLRTNDRGIDWSKLRNEELVPLLLLVNGLGLGDDVPFEIASENAPGADVFVFLSGQRISIQITVADPDWNNDGGRTRALEAERLRQEPENVAWGGGGTRKRDHRSPIVSAPQVVDHLTELAVCERAIEKAVQRKVKVREVSNWLLIYARGMKLQLIDQGFEESVLPILEKNNAALRKRFEQVFVVDGNPDDPQLISWPTPIAKDLLENEQVATPVGESLSTPPHTPQ